MIIKYTLNDNDFTQVIEKHLEEYGPFLATNFRTIDEYIEFKKDISRYEKLSENNSPRTQLKSKLTEIIKEKFKVYINSIKPNSNWYSEGMTAKDLIERKAYILDNIEVDIVNSITDKWQNGEVVYFITSSMKYLTM